MTTWFSVNEGKLRIEGDDIEWEGSPDGMSVLDLAVLSDPEAAVVLLNPPPGNAPVRNLVKMGSDASLLWHGELPKSQGSDCFVSIDMPERGLVVANTWSGYRVQLSVETGELVRQTFTK